MANGIALGVVLNRPTSARLEFVEFVESVDVDRPHGAGHQRRVLFGGQVQLAAAHAPASALGASAFAGLLGNKGRPQGLTWLERPAAGAPLEDGAPVGDSGVRVVDPSSVAKRVAEGGAEAAADYAAIKVRAEREMQEESSQVLPSA